MSPNRRMKTGTLAVPQPADFQQIARSWVPDAEALLAGGWRPGKEAGLAATMDRPGAGRWQTVDRSVWWAMCLIWLEQAGKVREATA